MNAVVYARFSSHRQGEQSIEGQVAEAERFAAAHGLTIVKVYADRAQTGRNDNREQFQLMLADAAKHAFDALIVWKTDRIGRNKEEIALNKYHLKKNGVKIYYVAEAIPDTPEGIILEAVIEGMAAYYSEQLSQNVRRGLRMCAQKAQSTGGTHLLGYTVDENKKYVIDPQHAPTVRLIFDMYAQGKTIIEIVRELNARGLRTKKGNLFTKNSLHRMMKNKKYIGTYEYNGEVYMIPESYVANEIAVFQSISFPSKWRKIKVLKNSCIAVDSTFFSDTHNHWMLTLESEGNDECFRLYKFTDGKLLKCPTLISRNNNQIRPAGNLFFHKGRLLRPAQDCSKGYGSALNFYHVTRIEEMAYEEELTAKITPSMIRSDFGREPKGIHTYNYSSKYEVIDLKYEAIDPWFNIINPTWYVWRRIKKIWR